MNDCKFCKSDTDFCDACVTDEVMNKVLTQK